MADEPISSTVPELPIPVETGVDVQTLGNLNNEFEDFWKEQDEKQDAAPAAPGDSDKGPSQETRAEKPESRPAEPEAPVVKESKDYSDEDIDKLSLPPNTRPEALEDFRQIRELWKQDRARFKSEAERAAKLEQDLNEARQNAWTPEQRQDYEHAAQIRRRFDFASDPEFVRKYHEPIRAKYESTLERAVQVLPDKEAARAWADHLKENYTPDQLSEQWWENKVLDKVPEGIGRTKLMAAIGDLQRMQEERDQELAQRTSDKGAFEQWINEKAATTSQRVSQEILAEINEQEKSIKEYLPRDIESAKTKEEREAIRVHNERFDQLNDHFKGILHDLSKNGPRAWVRASMQATQAKIIEENFKNLEKDYKQACTDRDKYKSELDKITGARRKLANSSGTTPASSQKKPGSLTLKDLDVRKAFENFDWGET